jgi:hypothetical protein
LRSEGKSLEYKVVETSTVADDVIEGLINEWVGRGWHFDDIRFVLKESSRRPAMAFLFFTRRRVSTGEPSDLNT